MLRIQRGQLGGQRLDGPFLPDDLIKALRAQQFHHGLRKADLLKCLELLPLLRRLRRFNILFLFLQDLHLDILDIVLMVFLELLCNLALDLVLDTAARHDIRHILGKVQQDLRNLLILRHLVNGRILQDNAL